MAKEVLMRRQVLVSSREDKAIKKIAKKSGQTEQQVKRAAIKEYIVNHQ